MDLENNTLINNYIYTMEKIYAGNAKVAKTKFGEMFKVSFSKEDINKMVTYMKSNNLEWINLDLKEKKNKVEGKSTHYLQVDTWKPDTKQESDDLPF